MLIKCVEGPCKNCQERYVGCHSTCKPYLDYKKQIEDIHKKANFVKLMERRR